jgi:hypothetical protein
MLDPAIALDLKPHFDQLRKVIRKMEIDTKLGEFKGDLDAASSIVQVAFDKLPKRTQTLMRKAHYDPEEAALTYLADDAFEKIKRLRGQVRQELAHNGRTLDMIDAHGELLYPKIHAEVDGKLELVHQHVPRTEITSQDILSETIERHLLPFEREILTQRKYMVKIRRYVTAVSMEMFDPEGRSVGQGLQFPSASEAGPLSRGRAKQVPMQAMFADIQTARPEGRTFDFMPTSPNEMSKFAEAPAKVLSAAEKRAKVKIAKETAKFYGKKGGLTLRQRERRIATKAKQARRAREKAARARTKKSEPLHVVFLRGSQ